MEKGSTESKETTGSEAKNGRAPENIHTIKLNLPLLSIVKGMYDAYDVQMGGPAATSDLPKLPQSAKNIWEQLRLTILKRLLAMES